MHPNDGRVVSNFIVQALNGAADHHLRRRAARRARFCYVDDLIEGFVRLMATPDEVTGPDQPRQPGRVHHLELAEKVIELTGSRSKIDLQAAARGRSAAAPARHRPGARDAAIGSRRCRSRKA